MHVPILRMKKIVVVEGGAGGRIILKIDSSTWYIIFLNIVKINR